MEEQDYRAYQVNRVIMQSLALILDDMSARIKKDQEHDARPSIDERLRLAEANRLIEELNHVVSIQPVTQHLKSKEPATARNPSFTGASRIVHKINTGDIKLSSPQNGKEDMLSFGISAIELTENDEITDVIAKEGKQNSDIPENNSIPLQSKR